MNENRTFCPEEITSMILAELKEMAENYLNDPVKDVVISVPACFNDYQRQAMINSGTIAGLNVLRIISEPLAVAFGYGLDKQSVDNQNLMIFDLGGGTLDVSIINFETDFFTVNSTCGNAHLGGKDFDNRLVDFFVKEFEVEYSKDLTTSKRALRRLRRACELAKIKLSSSTVATIELDSLFEGLDFKSSITRTRFEELNNDLFESLMKTVLKVFANADVLKKDIHNIVLVGGSTHIPKVRKLLLDFFEGKFNGFYSFDPDEAVVHGAAIQAAILLRDKSEIIQDMCYLDVIPNKIGIENQDELMQVIFKGNTYIPISEIIKIQTEKMNQTDMQIKVYAGDNDLVKDNKLICEFELSGIRIALSDKLSTIQVKFIVDSNGILNLEAFDISTTTRYDIGIIKRHSPCRGVARIES